MTAKSTYQAVEKKALTKPNGFYENKLELLTETIIYHERQQQIKTRQLSHMKQVKTLMQISTEKIPKPTLKNVQDPKTLIIFER